MTAANLFDPAIKADPYPIYESIRDEGPVTRHELFPMWMVTGFDAATSVLSDAATFSSGGAVRPGPDLFGAPVMLFSDPPVHTRLRATVVRAFTPRSIAALQPRIARLAQELVDRPSSWEVVSGLSTPLPVMVIADMLGVPSRDHEQFKRWSDDLVAVNTLVDTSGAEAAWKGAQELRSYMADAVRRRRADPGDDLISRLIAANADGSIDDDELLAACVLLMVAGNETTTNLISNAVLALARRPDLVAALRDDPSRITPLIEEILRWDPPVHATVRAVVQPAMLENVTLSPGEMVMVLLAAANRDPRRFEAPTELRPGRPDGGHVAFGHGIHFCLGATVARLEATAAIGALVARAPKGWTVDDDTVTYGPSFFLRGLSRLRITIT